MTNQDNLFQNILLGGALGVGAYFLIKEIEKAKKKKEEEEEDDDGEEPTPPNGNEEPEVPDTKPEPHEFFPIAILDPSPGETWSGFPLIPHTVNVSVHNPYNSTKIVFVGMSMIEASTGRVFDFPVRKKTFKPNQKKNLLWLFTGTPSDGGIGLYYVISAVWDIMPYGDCQAEGTCHRLSEAESDVTFTWIGI